MGRPRKNPVETDANEVVITKLADDEVFEEAPKVKEAPKRSGIELVAVRSGVFSSHGKHGEGDIVMVEAGESAVLLASGFFKERK